MSDTQSQRRPFRSEYVIREEICTETLRAFHVGFDEGSFRMIPLVETIRNVIPEFAFGFHEGMTVPLNEMVDRIQEAARAVYTTDKYHKRGEFGELILHLLLRDFCGTTPLLSKIYFKDTENMPAHGFDGVHVTSDPHKRLWLGESKLYADGRRGVADLATDVTKHVNSDFLRREFMQIKRKLAAPASEVVDWQQLLDKHRRIDEIFQHVVFPMVATYSSGLFKEYSDESEEYLAAFVEECEALHKHFFDRAANSNALIILFLLPVEDKDKLIKELDRRLKAMQTV